MQRKLSLMQEYEKAKAKLAQIQEKKRKVLETREEATVATSLDPKGIEHKHVNTALPSAENSFDTDSLLDLNEAGSADGDDELFGEDIGTGDSNINADIDPLDPEPSSQDTDHDASDLNSSFVSEGEGDQPEGLGQNEWRMSN
jgi:hypothetical protein